MVSNIKWLVVRSRVLEVDERDTGGVLVPDDVPHDQIVVAEHDGTAEGRQLNLQLLRQAHQSVPSTGALLQPGVRLERFLKHLKSISDPSKGFK